MNRINNQFFKEISLSGFNGDCIRIICFIVGSGQVRLNQIEEALGLSKTTVSRYCKQLHKIGVLNRFNIIENKRVYPLYSINYNYKIMEVKENETI